MSSEKGKGRAANPEEADKGPSDPSLLSRVAASATGLTRNVFAPPTGAAWAESSKTPTQQTNSQASPESAFRVGHNEEHVRQSENEFSEFLDGIASFTPSENAAFASGGLAEGGGMEEAWSRSQPRTGFSHQELGFRSISEQQSRDGEGVLAILTQPGNTEGGFEAPQEDENYDWGLSNEQLSQLRAMTKHLFPHVEAHGAVDADHPLNLAPNFDGVYGHDLVAIDALREQWDGVLNGYTDEVWGGLLPLVKEARREVDDLHNDSSRTEQPKALRRLGAILGHLRQY
jgi:hypothetical protein